MVAMPEAIGPGIRNRLRPMNLNDLDAVLDIEAAVQRLPWSRHNFVDALTVGYETLVLPDLNGDIIAYGLLSIGAGEAHLMNISVAPARQAEGIGRALLEALLARAIERGVEVMLLEVRPSNLVGRHLYESVGFRQIGLRRSYYPGPDGKEDAWVMERRL